MSLLTPILAALDFFNTGGGETKAPASQPGTPTYHIAWDKWGSTFNWKNPAFALATLLLIVLLGAILTRIFRRFLKKYRLERSTKWAFVTVAFYFAILAWHPYLLMDPYDILALIIHKSFVAILLIVAVIYFDRLVIFPLLTRISKNAPSRFVHQIVIFVVAIFVLAGYCSWAFNIEIGSFLAGSAVISIVLGLALQETLGNFFSGMVLQASVPFQPGDWIQIGDTEGRVVEMTWRAVTLLTGANNYVLLPNSTVAKEKIVNYHSPSVATATSVSVGLEYELPPNEAKRVLRNAAMDAPGVLATPAPSASLVSFDDSAITYKVFFWIDAPQKHGAVEEAVRCNVWYRLNQAGYGIPFPVRTVEMTDMAAKSTAAAQGAYAERLDAIRKSPLFADIAPELQEKLAGVTRGFSLAAGQAFYRQDDPGNSLFILQSGTVTTYIRNDNIATQNTAAAPPELDAGDMTAPAVFGEISALTAQPRGATLRAKTDVRAIEVHQHHLQELFTHDPQLMTHFSNNVAKRQEHRDEILKKLGAAVSKDHQHAQPDSVLSRMKRLFTFGNA